MQHNNNKQRLKKEGIVKYKIIELNMVKDTQKNGEQEFS